MKFRSRLALLPPLMALTLVGSGCGGSLGRLPGLGACHALSPAARI